MTFLFRGRHRSRSKSVIALRNTIDFAWKFKIQYIMIVIYHPEKSPVVEIGTKRTPSHQDAV